MAKLAPGAAAVVNASLPLGHAQATWDIAMAAVFLASNGARCISGDTLVRWLWLAEHAGLLSWCWQASPGGWARRWWMELPGCGCLR